MYLNPIVIKQIVIKQIVIKQIDLNKSVTDRRTDRQRPTFIYIDLAIIIKLFPKK